MKSTHQATRVRFTPVLDHSRRLSVPTAATSSPRTPRSERGILATFGPSDFSELSWFAAIAEQSPDLIGMVSLEGDWLSLNPSGQAMLGFTATLPTLTTALNETMQQLWHQTIVPQMFESGHWRGQFAVLHQSDTIWFESQWFLVRDPYTNHPLGFATISRLIEPPDQPDLHSQRTCCIAEMVHELKTPLAVMSTSIDLLDREQLSRERKQKHFQRMRSKIQQMTQVLNDILILSRSEQAELVLQSVEIDPVCFCAELVEEARMNRDRHQIAFSAVSALPVIQIDSVLLQRIVTNLLSNAIKYSPNGGKIDCNLSIDSTELTLQIRDSGIGIPVAEQSELFRSFYRASNSGKIPGTGLGLAIVKKCVDLLNGQILVSSVENVGTCFTISIPL